MLMQIDEAVLLAPSGWFTSRFGCIRTQELRTDTD